MSRVTFFLLLFLCKQPRRVLIVQLEQELNPFGFIRKWLRTVTEIDCPVELLVSLYQRRWHGEGVVEVGEGGVMIVTVVMFVTIVTTVTIKKRFPYIKHPLRGGLHVALLFLGWILRPGVVVVD